MALQYVLAGLVQAEHVLRHLGQWQAADACADARRLLTEPIER